MNYDEKYKYASEMLKEFKNFLEVSDFRKFLLLILNLEGGGPEALMRQLGLGGKGKTILPYDLKRKAYFTKIMSGLSLASHLIIYHKTEKLSDMFLNKADSPMFEKVLTPFERKNLLPTNFMLISPQVVDYSKEGLNDKMAPKEMISGIETLFDDLGEFIASHDLKFVFFLQGKGKKPDIAFSMNVAFTPNNDSPNDIQYFDVFVDEEMRMRDNTFIRMENDELKLEFVKEIREFSHSEMYNSHYTIIVPIDSFNPP